MARYSEQEKMELRRVSIAEVMSLLGKRTDHERGSMYYSPFREENTPSFHIGPGGDTWYDFGMNEGGGLVDFVIRMLNCSRSEAYDFLASAGGTFIPGGIDIKSSSKKASAKHAVSVIKASKNFHWQLLQYARQRGISEEVLRHYCDDITYAVDGCPGRAFFAIGFRNNSGGYVLRSKDYKMCTSSASTTLSPDGRQTSEVSSSKALVFEGFMDFLSYVTLRGGGEPGYDICVLNSVANLDRNIGWLSAHSSIGAYLDNDRAGRDACRSMFDCVSAAGGDVCMFDLSTLYSGYKDLNEMLAARLKEHPSQTIKYQEPWNNPFQVKFRKD